MLGECPLKQLADPAWESRPASWWEETTKWSIKVQVGSMRWRRGEGSEERRGCPEEEIG